MMQPERDTNPKHSVKEEPKEEDLTPTAPQVGAHEPPPHLQDDDLNLSHPMNDLQQDGGQLQDMEQDGEADGDGEDMDGIDGKNLSLFMSMAHSMDSTTLLSAVGQRIFDHFTMFDLLLAKGKMSRQGILRSAVDDMSIMMAELKMLMENCLDPIRIGKVAIRKKSEDTFEMDELLAYAMGLDTNLWLKRQPHDVSYQRKMFDADFLYHQSAGPGNTGSIRIKKEITDDHERIKTNETDRKGERTKKSRSKNWPKAEFGQEESYTCEKCGKTYMSSTSWLKHMEMTCASKKALKISIRTVGEEFFCAFEFCDEPDKPFKTRDDVHDHWALQHVTDDMKIFPCFICPEKFATTGAQKVHMRTTHLKERLEKAALEGSQSVPKEPKVRKRAPKAASSGDDHGGGGGSKEKYLCLKCGQSMTKATGKKHEEKCTGMQVRRPEYKKVGDEFFCTVAGCMVRHSFPSMYGLNKHFHTTHTRDEEKYFACDYCEEKFSFNTTRNKHMAEKHLKNYVCDLCGKGFGGRSKLNSHRMLHTGEKPFACDRCDYRSAKKCNYEAHMESKHGVFTQKNFVCSVCNKQFQTMGRCRHHMELVHTQGKNEEEQKLVAKRQKRHKPAPPVEKQMSKKDAKTIKKVVFPPGTEPAVNMLQPSHLHQPQYHNPTQEQEAAVQYIQTELGQGDDRVISIRPLY